MFAWIQRLLKRRRRARVLEQWRREQMWRELGGKPRQLMRLDESTPNPQADERSRQNKF